MEFLLIGESKLKIIMSAEEMTRYKLDANQDTGSATVRRAIWRVLEMARGEVGFDPAGDKVLIQFYPIKSGGCEIFVTKLGILSGASARLVSRSDRVSMLARHKRYYVFDTLDSLASAVRAIKKLSDTTPESDVYIGEGERYYLALDEYTKGGEPAEFPCVLEFGRALTADFSVYVEEHLECVASGNGIELFSSL